MKPKAMIALAGVSTVATPFLFLPVGFSTTVVDRDQAATGAPPPPVSGSAVAKPQRAAGKSKPDGKS